MINIYKSRRDKFKKCEYYIRTNPKTDINTWVISNKPSGIFYAKPCNALDVGMGDANGVLLFDDKSITIETTDYVEDLKKGHIVKYKGTLWIVDSIQRKININATQYSNKDDYTTYIALKE